MKFRIIAAGKPALAYAKIGVDDYLRRLSRSCDCQFISVKAGSSADVSARLWEASTGCYRIALDERGALQGTRQLAAQLEMLQLRGDVKAVAFLIGAADGHTPALRDSCDFLLALSPLTLQHELALLVLLEQLYRIGSIRIGSPYHRD